MRTWIFIALACLIAHMVRSQDTLYVSRGDNHNIQCQLNVLPGYTAYSLIRATGASQDDFVRYNPTVNISELVLNTRLSLPLNPQFIQLNTNGLKNPSAVVYAVSQKETMYSISKIYAQKEVTVIKKLNNKKDNHLAIGEKLLLGYIDWPYSQSGPISWTSVKGEGEYASYNNIPQFAPFVAAKVAEGNEHATQPRFSSNIRVSKGIAYCDRRGGGTRDLVVMHPSAKVDTKIQLYNPMLRRKVAATVVSAPPQNSYPDDISIVISPSVADALGALDKRFWVEMTYIASN